jgi:hypothetical protein
VPFTPAYQFSADGGVYLLLRNNVGQRPSLMSLMYSQTEVPNQPIYYGLSLIPNVYFANSAELASVLNLIIAVVNSNTFTLGLSESWYLPMFTTINPSAFNDAINDVVKEFNYLLNKGMGVSTNKNIKSFLSVSPAELTMAVNTLIDEINAIYIPYIGNFIKSNSALPGQSVLNLVIPPGNILLMSGGNLILV